MTSPAQFSNVTTGMLNVDGQSYALQDGFALRSSLVPAVRTMMWSLADAQLRRSRTPAGAVALRCPATHGRRAIIAGRPAPHSRDRLYVPVRTPRSTDIAELHRR